MDIKQALREVLEKGFGAGDLTVADSFAGDTIIEHEYLAPTGVSGPETLRAQITSARQQMPGLNMTVEQLTADGDLVWARSVAHAPNPRGGEPLSITVMDLCRFADGRIVEHWGVPDRFALLHQLGALPQSDPVH